MRYTLVLESVLLQVDTAGERRLGGSMLIATFGASTGWQGKKITYDGGQFALEGHGPIPAAGVLEYERQGHLIWASTESRELAYSVLRGGRRPIERRRIPGWAAALVIGGVAMAAILGIAAARSSMNEAVERASGSSGSTVEIIDTSAGQLYTMDQFHTIQTGMTLDQVTAIVGTGGDLTAQNDVAGYRNELYSYQNTDGSNMLLQFQNGMLIQKAQFGLE